jgi:hypothetical protein
MFFDSQMSCSQSEPNLTLWDSPEIFKTIAPITFGMVVELADSSVVLSEFSQTSNFSRLSMISRNTL